MPVLLAGRAGVVALRVTDQTRALRICGVVVFVASLVVAAAVTMYPVSAAGVSRRGRGGISIFEHRRRRSRLTCALTVTIVGVIAVSDLRHDRDAANGGKARRRGVTRR